MAIFCPKPEEERKLHYMRLTVMTSQASTQEQKNLQSLPTLRRRSVSGMLMIASKSFLLLQEFSPSRVIQVPFHV